MHDYGFREMTWRFARILSGRQTLVGKNMWAKIVRRSKMWSDIANHLLEWVFNIERIPLGNLDPRCLISLNGHYEWSIDMNVPIFQLALYKYMHYDDSISMGCVNIWFHASMHLHHSRWLTLAKKYSSYLEYPLQQMICYVAPASGSLNNFSIPVYGLTGLSQIQVYANTLLQ